MYTRIRYYFFIYTRKLQTSTDVSKVGWLEYSQTAFKSWRPLTRRIDFLVNTLDNNLEDKNSRLLVIGPRFECEVYGYLSLGLKKNNIQALDTFSYSPKVKCGNMHDLSEFASKPFDLIVLGWTIVYSENPSQAFSQLELALSRNGKIIITWDSPSEVLFEDLQALKFQNTIGDSYYFTDFVSKEKVVSWSVTRPSYNPDIQVVTIVYAPK